MLDERLELPFQVTDLKQWAYCPRILYYRLCVPQVRPVTYKMTVGIEAGHTAESRERRRTLQAYGLSQGARQFNVPLASERWGLRGEVDMVIETEEGGAPEAIPVDYKLARRRGRHFQLQLAAYAVLLEEAWGVPVKRAFLYYIPLRRADCIRIDKRLRTRLDEALSGMRAMLHKEQMPPPTPQRRKCVSCEFRRFCNDVI